MAQAYIGLFHWADGVPTESDIAGLRAGDGMGELGAKVRALPANLPDSCRLVNAYAVGLGDLVSVMIVEAESGDDLAAINQYYFGWFRIDWTTTNIVERD